MSSGNRSRRSARVTLAALLLLSLAVVGCLLLSGVSLRTVRANNTAQTLPFVQDWTNTALITANDNWAGVPGIEGFFLNNSASSPTGVDPQTILGDIFAGGTTTVDLDVIANQTAPDTLSNGGVAEFHGTSQGAPANTNPTIALNGSGTADAPFIQINLNTTGNSSITVSYNVRDLDCSGDNTNQQLVLQYRVGNSGNYANVAGSYIADATTGPSICTLVTPISVSLPVAAENQPLVQLRILSTNAPSNDEWIGIDDISITAGVNPDVPPTVSSTVPTDNAANIAVNANVSVTFSEAVTASSSSFTISCASSGAHTFSLSGGPTTYTLDPGTDFTQGEVCTVTVVAAQVADQDGTADQMAADYVFDFTVINTTPVAIHDIQGSGTSSPLAGSTVTTSGIVTLLRTSSNAGGVTATASGFFLQAPDANADADPNTSEGIFVFTSSVPAVGVGDNVTVTGTAVEFNGLTEISPVSSIVVNSTGNTLPAAVTLTTTILDSAALYTQPQLEKYEAMRMSAASLTATVPNDNFFDVAVVLSSVPRQQVFREPGIPASDPVPPDPTSGLPDCCIAIWDENPERLSLDTNGRALAPTNPYTSNVIFSNVAGPLDFAFGQYRLIPDAALSATANMSAVPVPTPQANEFTVVGYNIENFNNNATQREKAALTVRTVLRYPDIIGAVEIFDLADLQALRDEINNDAVAAGDPNPVYEAYLVEQDGTSEDSDQDVGYLVKTSRVQVNSVTQELEGETFVEPGTGAVAILHDRPPLVLDANVDPTSSNTRVLVVVNHLRSFIDAELVAGDGPRVREKRKLQAESLAALLQQLHTNNPNTPVISVGDYNAFQFSSGYDDSLSVLKGSPTADDQIVVDQSPDLVNPNFVNLIEGVAADQRYSFAFGNTAQVLDHILVNTRAQALNTRVAVARVNIDFPEVPAATYADNAAIPERNSDHDPAVAYFILLSPTAADGSVTGTITDANGAAMPGTVINLTGTQNRKTITDANGQYRFDNVETSGFYTVTPSRLGYTFGPASRSFSQLGNSTEAAFTGTPNAGFGGNSIDTAEYFVRQHYLDFLGREPDESGFNFWSDQILDCGSDAACAEVKRVNVSAAYFLSIEFQETGGLVDGLYRAGFGRAPRFAEFMPDAAAIAQNVVVGRGDWAGQLATNKRTFIQTFVDRSEFRAAYDGLTDAAYVDQLINHTGVSFSSAERETYIDRLGSGSSRADVLLSIAENDRFVAAKRNKAFVMMEYFGYLRRDPDESGYEFWLNKLNQFDGNFERAEMVKAFISSSEYLARFAR